MLDEANHFHPNIKLVRQIGTSLSFLDVFIENKNGILVTSVYHKEAAEPYIVPFKSDHPRHVFRNIIEGALLRAIRYSSTLDIFNQERRTIQLMLLYNGYPPRFIYTRFKEFLSQYISSSSSFYLLIPSCIETEIQFSTMRTKVLQQKTDAEHQLLYRVATITDNEQDEQAKDKFNQIKQQKEDKWDKCVIVHYKHEQRFATYKRDFHQLWNDLFNGTPILNTKLIVGNRNNLNTKEELVSKRPVMLSTTKNKYP
ncbi:unnamed protein product [Didymodactylos carnosus]|uniref:Helix-turn-helix domain-containing protein n=2 Tax=Didymodactylos carnosus TaxID=1234261 RepID=A0A814YCF7_9BILA|nr:unnamed protein product [Didymodactylos carnosus]CAF3990307.1 unnamed protein product [Didymodactylos carnosus]